MTHINGVPQIVTQPGDPIVNPGLMPPAIPVHELRYYPAHSEVVKGHLWHTIPVGLMTIESARDGTVTVGLAGYFGDDALLYEIDLTPDAAEQLALRLVRRAHDVRWEASANDAEFEDA